MIKTANIKSEQVAPGLQLRFVDDYEPEGNPNTKNLPNWTPYTRENGATMIFYDKSEMRFHHDKNLMKLLEPTYKL